MKRRAVLVLLVLAAVTVCVSVVYGQSKEEITLTTIVPDQTTLLVKKGAVGNNYYRTNPASIQNSDLYVEGNVGIGTTMPGAKLQVTGSGVSGIDYITKIAGNNGADNLSTVYDYDAGVWRLRSGGANSPPIAFNIGSGEKMRIANSGNVGIGTTNPQATLDVSGTVKMFGSWQTMANNTVYQASTDGFVMGNGYNQRSNIPVTIYTDANNPPTTIRARGGTWAEYGDGYSFAMSPVKKGDYWKVTNATTSVYWLPLGH